MCINMVRPILHNRPICGVWFSKPDIFYLIVLVTMAHQEAGSQNDIGLCIRNWMNVGPASQMLIQRQV